MPGEWTFPDFPLRGVYPENEVYAHVHGWDSFEPWLSLIEKMNDEIVWAAAGEIPPEWYGSDWGALEKLVLLLLSRRSMVRELITAFRMSPRRPFPELASRSVRCRADGRAKRAIRFLPPAVCATTR